MGTTRRLAAAIAVVAATAGAHAVGRALEQAPNYGVGRPPRADELKALDIDVTPDGRGLRPGGGTAEVGKEVYTRRCETCHGPTGKEGPQDVLVGGQGSL